MTTKIGCEKKLFIVSSIDQSIDQLISQSFDQLLDQSIDELFGQSVYQHVDYKLPFVVAKFENNPPMQPIVD